MPHIYLAPWQWTSAIDGEQWDAPHSQFCLQRIDLRPVAAQAQRGGAPQGFGLFVYDRQVSVPGVVYFGDDLHRVLAQQEKDAWKGPLNISEPVEGVTLEDVVWNTLTIHADATGQDRVKPLLPQSNGELSLRFPSLGIARRKTVGSRDAEWSAVIGVLQADYRRMRQEFLDAYPAGDPRREHYKKVLGAWRLKYRVSDHRVFIPPDLPDEGWLPPSTTITESFNQADSSTLGPDLTWVEHEGGFQVLSNRVEGEAGHENAMARADSALSSDDHQAQIVDVNSTTKNAGAGPAVRRSTSAATYYRLVAWSDATLYLQKIVSGTKTGIATAAYTETNGAVIRLEVNGSTLKMFYNGSQHGSDQTDTAITGNLYCGFGGDTNTGTFQLDDFEASDLSAGGGFAHSRAIVVG